MLLAVPDLETAARDLETRYGLVSVAGGRHPSWGTANRIVPLGSWFIELVSVVDVTSAGQSTFGRWVASASPATLLGWSVRTQALDDVARSLRLDVAVGSRVTDDGRTLRWRLAGVERAALEPALPFFIQWDAATAFPGRAPAAHRVRGVRLASLVLDGDADRLATWLGVHDLPLTVRRGKPAVDAVVLATVEGEIVLDGL